MSGRVLSGDIRHAYGRDFIVLRTARGKRGEARTMVVLGIADAHGVATAIETRAYATVASWPRCGRVRVALRDAGGYYYAPWRGKMPRAADGVPA